MPSSTYISLRSVTLGTAQSQFTFNNIPQNYTDLMLVYSAKTTSGAVDVLMRLNGDSTGVDGTSGNYSQTILSGTGTAAFTTKLTSYTKMYADYYGALSTGLHNIANINLLN